MAVRQKSDSKTGTVKKPRIQCVLSEPLLAKLEEFAAAEGWSVSRSTEHILRQFFETRGAMAEAGAKPLAPVDEPGQHQKLLQLLELGKAAGLL